MSAQHPVLQIWKPAGSTTPVSAAASVSDTSAAATTASIAPCYRHYSFIHRWPARHCSWHTYWRPRVVIGAPIARPTYARYNSYAAAPAPITSRPSCSSKQYTPQGAVVFVDRCTRESEMNPPPETNSAGYQQGAPMPQQA